ncbi:MAG: 50S ribosomal protein L24 [Flavobacteriales bacterium]|nr:50S ribosomal protein L24 [Flavobacteriales bacterium]
MGAKIKIKKGDTVKVISGTARGQQGRVLSVLIEKNRVLVEGVNMISKHTKPNAANPQGGIVKQEAAVHISNVMLVEGSKEPTRVGRRLEKDKLVRYSKKTGETIKS